MRHFPIFLIGVLTLLTACGEHADDYFDTGIDGRWQMTKIKTNDGTETEVKNIYYSFKKDICNIQKTSPYVYSFGTYEKKGDSLIITMKDYLENFEIIWDGDLKRGYKIEKKSSSKLELNHEGDIYYFRKY